MSTRGSSGGTGGGCAASTRAAAAAAAEEVARFLRRRVSERRAQRRWTRDRTEGREGRVLEGGGGFRIVGMKSGRRTRAREFGWEEGAGRDGGERRVCK